MAEEQIANGRLIIIGGSSGSLEALLALLPLLRHDFSIPIILVLHRSQNADNGLVALLSAKTRLTVKEADEKDILQPGCIYIAPPDYHLLLEEDGSLSLDVSEKVNYCRPSIDVTFASAAPVYTTHLTAVLLSGANADGAAAMGTVKEYGGKNIVQSPGEALVDFMPLQAISSAPVDHVLPAADIAAVLNKL